jgi:hypothetical protein
LDSCENLPPATKDKLKTLGASSLSSVLRKYYILAAKALGLRDTKESGIRCGGESSPIGSQAAFTFADTEELSPTPKEDDDGENRSYSDETNPLAGTSDDVADTDRAESPNSRGAKRSSGSQSDSSENLQPQLKVAKTEAMGRSG